MGCKFSFTLFENTFVDFTIISYYCSEDIWLFMIYETRLSRTMYVHSKNSNYVWRFLKILEDSRWECSNTSFLSTTWLKMEKVLVNSWLSVYRIVLWAWPNTPTVPQANQRYGRYLPPDGGPDEWTIITPYSFIHVHPENSAEEVEASATDAEIGTRADGRMLAIAPAS